MKTTPRWNLPYPELEGDSPDVPMWMEKLAISLDGVAMDDQGALASRPVSTVANPGKKGRYYYTTDTGILYRDYGTGWAVAGGNTRSGVTQPSVGASSWTIGFGRALPDAHYGLYCTAITISADNSASTTIIGARTGNVTNKVPGGFTFTLGSGLTFNPADRIEYVATWGGV